jgi:predicted glycoside hydrolase/deacetylase ChbG (UPF0249 family)
VSARRLIVNADDLGRTEGVNQGVFEAHRSGFVTSTTMMVNYAAAAGVPVLSAEHPGLAIGLHLQLSGGPACLPAERIPSLVDRDGRLPPRPDGLSEADPAEVLAEARAQLERFRALMGRDPTHFDSHHHSQQVPSVLAALVALARETGHPVRPAEPAQVGLLRREGIRTVDRFCQDFFGEAARLDVLLAILRDLPEGTTELMCHPARVDDALKAGSSYSLPRGRELSVLTSAEAREGVRSAGIELVGYGSL